MKKIFEKILKEVKSTGPEKKVDYNNLQLQFLTQLDEFVSYLRARNEHITDEDVATRINQELRKLKLNSAQKTFLAICNWRIQNINITNQIDINMEQKSIMRLLDSEATDIVTRAYAHSYRVLKTTMAKLSTSLRAPAITEAPPAKLLPLSLSHLRQKDVASFITCETVKQLLLKVNEEIDPTDLSILRVKFLNCLQDRIAKIRYASKMPLTNEELANILKQELNSIELTPLQITFLSECLGIMNQYEMLLETQINDSIDLYSHRVSGIAYADSLDGMDGTERDQVASLVKLAYADIFSPITLLLSKFDRVAASEPDLPRDEQQRELKQFILNENSKAILSKVSTQFFVAKYSEKLKNEWTQVQQDFNKWVKTNKDADLSTFLIAYYQFSQLQSFIVDNKNYNENMASKGSESTGSDEIQTLFPCIENTLSKIMADIRLNALSEKQKEKLSYAISYFLSCQNENKVNNDSQASKNENDSRETLFRAVLSTFNSSFQSAKHSSVFHFLDTGENSIALNNTSLNKTLDATLSLLFNKDPKSKAILTEIKKTEADVKSHSEKIDRSFKTILEKVKSESFKNDVQKKAITTKFTIEKYSLSSAESSLLMQAIGLPSAKIIPQWTSEKTQPSTVITYEQFITKAKEKLQSIEQRNAAKSWYNLKERTDYLKVAIDFVAYVKFKHDQEINPAAYLREGYKRHDKSLSDRLIENAFIIKPKMAEKNLTHIRTFRVFFNKRVASLSFFNKSNRALKKLAASFESRQADLRSENQVNPRKLHGSLVDKATKEKQYNAATKDFSLDRPFTDFGPLSGAIRNHTGSMSTERAKENAEKLQKDLLIARILCEVPSSIKSMAENGIPDYFNNLQNKLVDLERSKQAAELGIDEKNLLDFSHQTRRIISVDKVVDKTTRASFEEIETNYNHIISFMSKVAKVKNDLNGEELSLEHYQDILIKLGYEVTNFAKLLEIVQEIQQKATNVLAQANFWQENLTIASQPLALSALREAMHGIYLEEVNKLELMTTQLKGVTNPTLLKEQLLALLSAERQATTDPNILALIDKQLAELPKNQDTFEIYGDDAFKNIGMYVTVLEKSLMKATQTIEKTATDYQNYLSAEVTATSQLLTHLTDAMADKTKLDYFYFAAKENQKGIQAITSPQEPDQVMKLTAYKLDFVIQGLNQVISSKDVSLEETVEQYKLKLQNLKKELCFQQDRVPLIVHTANEVLESVKYSVNHETHLFGLSTL